MLEELVKSYLNTRDSCIIIENNKNSYSQLFATFKVGDESKYDGNKYDIVFFNGMSSNRFENNLIELKVMLSKKLIQKLEILLEKSILADSGDHDYV